MTKDIIIVYATTDNAHQFGLHLRTKSTCVRNEVNLVPLACEDVWAYAKCKRKAKHNCHRNQSGKQLQIDLMFMKHYAPNRCLYINVAKLRTGVGSAETSYQKLFFLFSPINLLIILYQLTKFEAPSCYSFRYIMNTIIQSPNLQREIIRKKYNFFLNFHQLISSSSSIS